MHVIQNFLSSTKLAIKPYVVELSKINQIVFETFKTLESLNLFKKEKIDSIFSLKIRYQSLCDKITQIFKNEKFSPFTTTFSESDIYDLLSSENLIIPFILYENCRPSDVQTRIAQNFKHFRYINGLLVSNQTYIDFCRTPIKLFKTDHLIDQFGFLSLKKRSKTEEISFFIEKLKEHLPNHLNSNAVMGASLNLIHQYHHRYLELICLSNFEEGYLLSPTDQIHKMHVEIEDNCLKISAHIQFKPINFTRPAYLPYLLELETKFSIDSFGYVHNTRYKCQLKCAIE